jgi:hypothetical protein
VQGNVPKDAVNKIERCESGYNKKLFKCLITGVIEEPLVL